MWYRGKEYASTSELYTGLFNILYTNTNPLIRDTTEMQAILDVQATQLCEFLWAKDELFKQVYKNIDVSTTSNYIGSMEEYEDAFNLKINEVDSLSYQELRRKRIQRRLKDKKPYTILELQELINSFGIPCSLYMGEDATDYTTLYADCTVESLEGQEDLMRMLDNMIPMNIELSLTATDFLYKGISTKLRSDKTTTPYVLNGTYVLERNEKFVDSEENTLYEAGEHTIDNTNIVSIVSRLFSASVTAFANDSTALSTPTVTLDGDGLIYRVVVPSAVSPLHNVVIKTNGVTTVTFIREIAHSTSLTYDILTIFQNGTVSGETNAGLTQGVGATKMIIDVDGTDTTYNLTYSDGEYMSALISAGANDVTLTNIRVYNGSTLLEQYNDKTFTLKAGASTNLYWSITD